MAIKETTKATKQPTIKIAASWPGHTHALLDELQNFQEAGANHGGNGQEEGKLRCCASAQAQEHGAQMVAPEREVPGIMDQDWNRPMYTATDQDISLVRRMDG